MVEYRYTLEGRLAYALCRFSYGTVNLENAKEIAKKYLPILTNHDTALKHKSVESYARDILRSL